MPAIEAAPPQRYALFDKIGSGGMATVHLGRIVGAAGFARTVAIKRLHPQLADDPSFVSMFVDEARLAARIHHPNVVQTLDVITTDGQLLIVMEYVEGASLWQLWRAEQDAGQRIPLPVIAAVVCGLLHGLHAAHEAKDEGGKPLGLVHRDVSPQNVIVGVDGSARVLDFGVAKAVGRLQTTREGLIKGKLSYMAPEQARGVEVGPAADTYAVAVVLWELITGRRLFTATSGPEMLLDVISAAHQTPGRVVTGVPYALDTLVMRGLALRPGDRFPTARAMADALARAVPPAQPHDVGAWVERIVGEALSRRRVRISEIESDADAAPASSVRHPASEPRPDALPSTNANENINSQPSTISVAGPQRISRTGNRRSSGRVSLLAGAAMGAAIAGVSTALVLGAGRGRPDAARSSPSPSATTVCEPNAATADSAAATLPVSVGVTAVGDPVPRDMVEVPPVPPSASARTARPSPRPPGPQHGSDCTPPYTTDATGRLHFKRQCI